jgi:hypothetical protein
VRAVVLTIAVAAAGVLMLPAATAFARTTKGCPPRIHHERFGGADHIRVTKSFKCKDVRSDVRRWLADGAPGGPTNRELRPWTCKFGMKPGSARQRVRCKLRTSFGGTRPLRTYRMRFVYDIRG